MQELIEHGRTGLHFNPQAPDSLIAQVDWLLSHPAEWQQMRLNARREFEMKYSAEKNHAILMNIYAQAITSHRTSVD
jgi:glycosyltransferase involved in cell wall biosynthesis